MRSLQYMRALWTAIIVCALAWQASAQDVTIDMPTDEAAALVAKGKTGQRFALQEAGDFVTDAQLHSATTAVSVAVQPSSPAVFYYTIGSTLYKAQMDGTPISNVTITDVDGGGSVDIGAISWDTQRDKIWGGRNGAHAAFLIDPATGNAKKIFDLNSGGFFFIDGIAIDGNDDVIWVTVDVSTNIEKWDVSGIDADGNGPANYLGDLIPKNAAGGNLGSISGVTVGKGDRLYLGQNGRGEIVAVKKSDGSFIEKFATARGRDEDLECDLVTFANDPNVPSGEVLWSKDAFDGHVEAFEVDTDTCLPPGDPDEPEEPEDTTNPECEIVGLDMNVPVTLTVRVQDGDSGLDQIQVVKAKNANVTVPAFSGGETGEVLVTAEKVNPNMRSSVVLKVLDVAGNMTTCDPVLTTLAGEMPNVFALEENYPNPFNPETTIRFQVAEETHVRVAVYDLMGRQVKSLVEAEMSPGAYEVVWDGRDAQGQAVASGIYLYRMEAGTFTQTHRMTLLK